MAKTAAKILLFFTMAMFFALPCLASETVELYMTKAVYAMNIGDDARAFSWFGKVLSVDPGNVKALHLQGVVASRLGRFERAEEILKRCLAQKGAPAEARFDLGFVLYSQGRYREAQVQFDMASRAQVTEPSLPYYLGASLFRLKEYERAEQTLNLALESVPDMEVNIRFYLGASYYEMGRYSRSIRNLRRCLELSPGPKVAQRAEELLAAAMRDRNLAKWWDVQFTLGMAYDTNVLYEPEDLEVTDQAGFYGFTSFDGTLYPIKKRAGTLGAGYSFYQSIHYNPDSEVLGDFDLLRHAGRIEGMARLLGGYPGLYAGLDYEMSYASLGGQLYQVQHQFLPYMNLYESHTTSTKILSTVRLKRFPDYQERDGIFYEPGLAQFYHFMQRRGTFAAEVDYANNDAESDLYDYQGVRVFTGVLVPVAGGLSSVVGLQYRYLDYTNHPENRIDRKITTDFAMRYTVMEFFTTQLSYRFARNTSLERYSWQKHVTSLSFQVKF